MMLSNTLVASMPHHYPHVRALSFYADTPVSLIFAIRTRDRRTLGRGFITVPLTEVFGHDHADSGSQSHR